VPTPQGGGIAVVAAALALWAAALAGLGLPGGTTVATLAAAAIGLALLGGLDDIRPLPASPRLAVQAVCVAAVLLAGEGRIVPALPAAVETALLLIGGLWWVNLVNFMDGLDWLTVAALVPLTGALAVTGLAGLLPAVPTLLAAALAGALLGFAPANRPVARLFLGDVGSLPIGLLTGWLLLELARTGALAAALLLPLYYLADATMTLLARLRRGARISDAHREHFYQRATVNGWTVREIDARVFTLNLTLAALAGLTLAWPGPATAAAALAAGAGLVGLTLRAFGRPRSA